MKINFGDYTYFNGKTDGVYITKESPSYNFYYTQSRKFNENKFNQLVDIRQYSDAADYASQFHFSDPETQKAHENDDFDNTPEIQPVKEIGRASCRERV